MSPTIKALLVAGLAAVSSALPSAQKLDADQMKMYEFSKRQNEEAQQSGLTDVDILQFALTLEWLEGVFYQQGFAQFPDEQFAALGLDGQQVQDLKKVGETEFTHASFLLSAIAAQDTRPVGPCEYDFGFTDAAGMVATAAVLESVGVSAYLGAAPLVADAGILSAAGSILTVESRHQTFVRAASGTVAIPQAFDAPVSPRYAFSLAAPFIVSCPEGSALPLEAFPTLQLAEPADPAALAVGSAIRVSADEAHMQAAVACAFTSGGVQPGGTEFVDFDPATGACTVPSNVAGVTYLSLTSEAPLSGLVTDDMTVAGPIALVIT